MIYHLTDMPSGDIKYPGSTGIAGFIKMVGDRIFLRCLRINGRLYARDLAFILLSILGIPAYRIPPWPKPKSNSSHPAYRYQD